MYKAFFKNGLKLKYWQPTIEQATEHNLALLDGTKSWNSTDIVQRIFPNGGTYYYNWSNDSRCFVDCVRG